MVCSQRVSSEHCRTADRVCVCVYVCVCVRECIVGVGEPPFSRPQSTEFLLRLSIHMLSALHLTFVYVYILYMMTVANRQIIYPQT